MKRKENMTREENIENRLSNDTYLMWKCSILEQKRKKDHVDI